MDNSNKSTVLEKKIGQRIGLLRTQKDESQPTLAKAIGVSREIVNHWEQGTRHIKADHLAALADHFGVSVDYLCCRTDIKSPNPKLADVCSFTGLSDESVLALANGKNESGLSPFYDQVIKTTTFYEMLVDIQRIKLHVNRLKQSIIEQQYYYNKLPELRELSAWGADNFIRAKSYYLDVVDKVKSILDEICDFTVVTNQYKEIEQIATESFENMFRDAEDTNGKHETDAD